MSTGTARSAGTGVAPASVEVETCPVCASVDVRVSEQWFRLELERRDELADAPDDAVAVEFTCRECRSSWS